jgi:hypothetical protein
MLQSDRSTLSVEKHSAIMKTMVLITNAYWKDHETKKLKKEIHWTISKTSNEV